MSKVIIAKIENNLAENIHLVFDQLAPDLTGLKVLIKPNITSPVPGDSGVVTHPEVVRAVVRESHARGAAEVKVGDNPAGIDRSSTITAQKAGIWEAAEGCFFKLAERVVEVTANSRYAKTFLVSQAVFEADYIINLPIFKTSIEPWISCAIKNTFGYLPGSCKSQLHFKAPGRRRFSELLVDVFALRPPNLHILDALTIMEGNGPRGGPVRPLGKILASTDAVALDATAARMMGLDPRKVPLLTIAQKRGLGSFQESDIELIGEFSLIPNFRLPTAIFGAEEFFVQLASLKPVVFEDKCIPCELCEERCPSQAITVNRFPAVDTDKCISCMVCAESCPTGAIEAPAGKAEDLIKMVFGIH